MKYTRLILCGVLLMGAYSLVFADIYEPVPQCYKPAKPLWFATSLYQKRYDDDVKQYHDCLKAFIKKQTYAAKMHSNAAQNALNTWNRFINNQ